MKILMKICKLRQANIRIKIEIERLDFSFRVLDNSKRIFPYMLSNISRHLLQSVPYSTPRCLRLVTICSARIQIKSSIICRASFYLLVATFVSFYVVFLSSKKSPASNERYPNFAKDFALRLAPLLVLLCALQRFPSLSAVMC